MDWLAMNWFIVVAVISALLLGWGVGVWYGTNKGYSAALEQQRYLESQMNWSDYFKKINKQVIDLRKEMKNEE
jgi:hypothetical protein